ncbi:hypothetical protein [Flindersiella endophytica]
MRRTVMPVLVLVTGLALGLGTTAQAAVSAQPARPSSQTTTRTETHTLTIEVLDRNGEPAQNSGTVLVGLDSDFEMPVDGPSFQADLPEGRYLLDAQITTATANGEERTRLVQPLIDLDRDTTISADARLGRPLEVTLPEPSAKLANGQIHFRRFVDGKPVYGSAFALLDLDHHFTAQLGPAVPAEEMEVYVDGQWGKPSGATEYEMRFFNTPYIYGLMWREPAYPTGLRKTVTDAELATVTSRQFSSATGSRSRLMPGASLGGISSSPGSFRFDLPATVTLHLSSGDVRWSANFYEHAPPFDPTQGSVELNYLGTARSRSYVAGRSYRETWNSAVLGPQIPTWLRPAPDLSDDPWPWFARNGDLIAVQTPLLSDRSGHVNLQAPYAGVENPRTALYRDGTLQQEFLSYGYIDAYGLDPAPGSYRLETSFERPLADISTKFSAAWTFGSAHTDGPAALPVSTIQFAPAVNERNQVTWRPTYTVPVTVQRQAGSTAGPVRTLDVDVSVDDGQTWIDTKLTRVGSNRWLATVSTPQGTHVTIRAKSADTNGNTVEQTITRAYGLS